jgi:hypothetical protein
MKPQIDCTSFGSITINGQKYPHDVLIRLDGTVYKRKKKLSKQVYGTSHKISLAETEYIYENGAEQLLIGTGQFDQVTLSDEARRYFEERDLDIILEATPRVVEIWNNSQGELIGLFHITC